jgi:hypothetical protein
MLVGSSSFAPLTTPTSRAWSHQRLRDGGFPCQASSSPNNDDDDRPTHKAKGGKNAMVSVAATAAILLNSMALSPLPATAAALNYSPALGESTQLLAGRSGGRAGGRAAYRAPSSSARMAAPRTTYRSSTTIIRPMIAPPPVVISPFGAGIGFGGGYGYNPMGGFGLGYGLGALNSAGNEVRDYRQESEIQRSKAELEQAKAKEAELEARLKVLEEAQNAAAAKQ